MKHREQSEISYVITPIKMSDNTMSKQKKRRKDKQKRQNNTAVTEN